jgi:esterase/lipase superfamily enzyme
MPVPNLYHGTNAPELFEESLSSELKSSEVDLLFITDRQPETDDDGNLIYGYKRSYSLAYGSAVVSLLPQMGWEELERISLERERAKKITLELTSIEEQSRFPKTPWSIVTVDGVEQIDPAIMEAREEARMAFQAELQRRLALSPKPEVLLFVHGFNNQFKDAALTLAEMWHFMGRDVVPVLYTWPAGKGGLSGYSYDRESGEFTTFHLKNTIRRLAETPGVEKIHLLAHSRGTDVLTAASRELMLENRGSGVDPMSRFKIENVVLAAPDLDIDVTLQRLVAERLSLEVGEVTIYTSQGDRAIGAAKRLFGSRERLGRVDIKDVDPERKDALSHASGIAIVDLKEKVDRTGHGYFHNSPEASSDLIMMVRYGLQPGAEGGRPLTPVGVIFWQIDSGYPNISDPKP